MGNTGVALATVIAYYLERVILMIYTKKSLGIAVSTYTNTRKMVVWTTLLFLAYIVAEVLIFPIVSG